MILRKYASLWEYYARAGGFAFGAQPGKRELSLLGSVRWPDATPRETLSVPRLSPSTIALTLVVFAVALGTATVTAADPQPVPAADATATADAGRDRNAIYRYDPMDEKLYPIKPAELRPGHVYGRFDSGRGRWVWSKADAAGNLRYTMGEGSTQPARMFDLRGTDAERRRALERRSPELARLFAIQGARPMLRLDASGRWELGPTPCVSSVFDEATAQRWEWHGDAPSLVVHSGGTHWRVHEGWYAPSY